MELNAEQIKKALECCGEYTHGSTCNNCPYMYIELADNDICSNIMSRDALSLITSQEQRIKELTEENERLQKALNTDISIVRVSRGSGKTAHLREVGRIKADAIRADTVREMQERLKQVLHDEGRISYYTIDKIAKEMLEGNK
jgi:uncharacterized small protein (DUF1192 family)